MRRAAVRPFAAGAMLVLAVAAFGLASAACRRPKYAEGLYADVATNKGLIVLRLEFEKVPMTVANFVGLAEGTIDNSALPPGRPFFDGTKWHRVVPGHVVQCGMGAGGEAEDPGYEFPNEIVLPGLDAAIGRMKKGEKRLVVVRPEMGYTANGFYAKQRPGEKRFVISPNTLLVYEVESLDIK